MDAGDITAEVLGQLKSAARSASERAYCPYSKFPVGAAVLADTGEIFDGCNVENASFGLTICAERNAVFRMVANGTTRIRVLAIYTPTRMPATPCGACRQVVNEFGPAALVVSFCEGPDVVQTRLSELLPQAFGPYNLE